MRNILMITSDYIPVYGGIGVHVEKLCAELEKNNCTICLLIARLKTNDEYHFESKERFIIKQKNQYLKIVEINVDYEQKLSQLQKEYLSQLDEKENFDYLCHNLNQVIFENTMKFLDKSHLTFDVVHTQDAFLGVGAVWIAKLLKLPLITTMHSTNSDKDWFIDNARRYLVNNSDYIICVSKFIENNVITRYAPTCKIETIYNSTNLVSKKAIKDENLQPDIIDIVYCGRLSKVKGVDILIKAASMLLKDNKDKNLHFSIIGEGEEEESLIDLVRILGIEDHITFYGYLENTLLRQKMKRAFSVVLPSRKEAFCTVALEAMAEGAVVLASDVGGFKEMIVHGTNGLLFPVDNALELAKSVQLLLEKPKIADKIKINAIKSVEDNFSWEKNTLKLIQIYDSSMS